MNIKLKDQIQEGQMWANEYDGPGAKISIEADMA